LILRIFTITSCIHFKFIYNVRVTMSNLILYAQFALAAAIDCEPWPREFKESADDKFCTCEAMSVTKRCFNGRMCHSVGKHPRYSGYDDEICVLHCKDLEKKDIKTQRFCKDSLDAVCWTEFALATLDTKCPPKCPTGDGKATEGCVCETNWDRDVYYYGGAKFQCREGDTCLTSEKLKTRDEVCKPGPRSRATGSTPADPRSPAGATNTGTIIGVSVAVVVVVLGIGAGVYWWFTRGRPSTKHKGAKQSLSRRGVMSPNGKKKKN